MQHLFNIKPFNELVVGGLVVNLVEMLSTKHHSRHHPEWEALTRFPSQSGHDAHAASYGWVQWHRENPSK